MKKLVVILLLAGTFLSFSLALMAEPDTHGRPNFNIATGAAYFLWRDGKEVHLRWSTKGGTHTFSGNITTNGSFHSVRWVKLEKGDRIWRAGSNNIYFKTINSGGIDGVDFRVTKNSSWISFDVLIDGVRRRDRVYIGASGLNPSGIPFTYSW